MSPDTGVVGTAGGERSASARSKACVGPNTWVSPQASEWPAASSRASVARRRTSMPNGVRALASGSRARPTLASSDRYGANSGPCTEASRSGANAGSAHSRRGERAPPGREGRGAAGPGRHHAVPLQDRVADRLPRGSGQQVADASRTAGARRSRTSRRGCSAKSADGQVVAPAEQRVDPGRPVRRRELVAQQIALAALGARWRSPPGRRTARRGEAGRPTPTTCRPRGPGRCRDGSRRLAPAPGRRSGTGPSRCGRR